MLQLGVVIRAAATTRWLYPAIGILVACVIVYALRGVLTPVLFAFLLAYVLDPLVDRVEARGLPRSFGIVLVLAVALAALVGFALLVLPTLVRDFTALVHALPAALERLRALVEPRLAAFGIELPHDAESARAALPDDYRSLAAGALGPVRAFVGAVLGGTASLLGGFLSALMVPIMAFYLLLDFDSIVAGARDLVPLRHRNAVIEIVSEVDQVLAQFLRGQVTVMAILAVLYALGYTLVGVPLAVPIGVVAGLVSFIPYVGGGVALGLALVMTTLHWSGWPQLAGITLVYAAVQALEGFVITPRVVGEKLGLAPVWILFALMAGGEVFGLLGVLLALPVAAVVKVLVQRALRAYRASTLYAGGGSAVGGVDVAPPVLLRLRLRRGVRRRRRAGRA